jgi:YfiH family protein
VADTRRRIVAGFHAGWRGTLGHIVEHGVDTLRRRFGSNPADLIAAIGPAIGSCCYAVGDEVRDAFTEEFAYAASLFAEVHPSGLPAASGPQIQLDLAAANRRQLLDAGVCELKISIVRECTACTRLPNGQRRYFSHRDEHGFTGRMLSVIGIGS